MVQEKKDGREVTSAGFRWIVFCTVFPACVLNAYSCDKNDPFIPPELVQEPTVSDTTVVYFKPGEDPVIQNPKKEDVFYARISEYAGLDFKHQSAAVYGDFALFVEKDRMKICLYDLSQKTKIYTATVTPGGNDKIYHCNQSSFGTEKYDPSDPFPLLYISQRPKSGNRCFVEVFRIHPKYNNDQTTFVSFKVELVQAIYFPQMTKDNSLGNVNCVIDVNTGKMYTYSRNNSSADDNYLQCKISRFGIPDFRKQQVVLEDSDIEESFMIDTIAENMQGACIVDGFLYIGQGFPSVRYIYLNVVDLQQRKLVKRYDLLGSGIEWEPEGCFYYDGSIMLSHTGAICRIEGDGLQL